MTALEVWTGRPGAGTTTAAAARARACAASGRKTLLVSRGEPDDLAEAAGLDDDAATALARHDRVEAETGLRLLALTPLVAVRQVLPGFARAYADVAGPRLAPPPPDAVTALPGVADVAALLALADLLAPGAGADVVVLDGGSCAAAAASLGVADDVLPVLDRLLAATPDLVAGARAGGTSGLPAGLLGGVAGLRAALLAARARVLGTRAEVRRPGQPLPDGAPDGGRPSVRLLVADGETTARTDRARAALGLAGLAPDEVVTRSGASTADPPVVDADDDPLLARVLPDGPDRFVLRLPLPGVRRDRLSLARHGDDLVLDVDGRRRVLRLPSVARRCVVEGARLADDRLRVDLVADPAVWWRQP